MFIDYQSDASSVEKLMTHIFSCLFISLFLIRNTRNIIDKLYFYKCDDYNNIGNNMMVREDSNLWNRVNRQTFNSWLFNVYNQESTGYPIGYKATT